MKDEVSRIKEEIIEVHTMHATVADTYQEKYSPNVVVAALATLVSNYIEASGNEARGIMQFNQMLESALHGRKRGGHETL